MTKNYVSKLPILLKSRENLLQLLYYFRNNFNMIRWLPVWFTANDEITSTSQGAISLLIISVWNTSPSSQISRVFPHHHWFDGIYYPEHRNTCNYKYASVIEYSSSSLVLNSSCILGHTFQRNIPDNGVSSFESYYVGSGWIRVITWLQCFRGEFISFIFILSIGTKKSWNY